jgi:RNA polymerase sigma-70 factor (family 1)
MQVVLQEKLGQIIQKDEQAFKELYRKFFVQLYRFSVSITHCNEAAEEIVDDVLINLWKKHETFNRIENLNVYLYVSVKNLSLNYLRDQGKHRHVDLETLYDQGNYITIDPESLFIDKERAEQLNMYINNLPARCKLIFRLVKEDGLKYKEVAALLNVSVKTIENQVAIAFKKIAAAIRCSE